MPRPFIQLFKTPRAQYVYDVNQNEFLLVSGETYQFLIDCMNGSADITTAELEEVRELQRQGYLKTESVVQDILHPYTPFLADFLERKIAHITLQVTQGCNLRCKYCVYSEDMNQHQRSHSNRHMNWETAKAAIDFLYDHSVDSESVAIGFYGGEPLLELPLIKQAVSYSKKLFEGKRVTYAITTNGTLLTDEIIRFFEGENISLMISLDGPKQIHDKNRVFARGGGSFDTIMKNVARIKEIAPEYYKSIQFSMVMDPANDFDCINEITVASADFNQHNISASVVEKDYDDDADVFFSEEYTWKYRYQEFLALLSMFDRFPRKEVSSISRGEISMALSDLRNSDTSSPLRVVDAPSGPCVPGQLRLFADVDGNLYPCERVSERSKAMRIGSLKNGLDISKAEKLLNVGAITKDACRNCWSIRHCGLCAKKADDGSETLSPSAKLSCCEEVRRNAYRKLRQLLLFNEVNLYYAEQVRVEGDVADEN